ncbi:MAG: NAD(P)H-binding protein [Cyclobacteriaceae bacterium]
MERIAVVTGATGLVGRELMKVLLANDHYSKIVVVGRRSLEIKDNRIEEIVVDFGQLDSIADKLNAQDHYCCLGTTMKKAGSKERFMKIDLDYPLALADIAKRGSRFNTFIVVTAVGADAGSQLFYNRIKGQLEDKLKNLGLKSLHIFQPSLLIGAREDFRILEEIAKFLTVILSFFIIGLNKFWSIRGEDVAKGMFYVAKKGEEGLFVHKPHEIRDLAKAIE